MLELFDAALFWFSPYEIAAFLGGCLIASAIICQAIMDRYFTAPR